MSQANTLYITQGSGNSFKPMQVLQQLGLDHRIRYMDVLGGETRREPFLSINPQGVVPFLAGLLNTGLRTD